MKKLLPPLFLSVSLFLSPLVFASSLSVSKDSGFSSDDLNFDASQKVYVKVESDSSGSSQKVLNIRDNQYHLINSVTLGKSGNTFSTSFNAPSSQGYYSLEAVIEGDGVSSKSVKTIKVGSPNSANVKVSVKSEVEGTKTEVSNESKVSNVSKDEENKGNNQDSGASPSPEVFKNDDNKTNEHHWVWSIISSVFSWLWPF